MLLFRLLGIGLIFLCFGHAQAQENQKVCVTYTNGREIGLVLVPVSRISLGPGESLRAGLARLFSSCQVQKFFIHNPLRTACSYGLPIRPRPPYYTDTDEQAEREDRARAEFNRQVAEARGRITPMEPQFRSYCNASWTSVCNGGTDHYLHPDRRRYAVFNFPEGWIVCSGRWEKTSGNATTWDSRHSNRRSTSVWVGSQGNFLDGTGYDITATFFASYIPARYSDDVIRASCPNVWLNN